MASRKSVWARVCAFLFNIIWLGYMLRILIWLSQGLNTLLGPVFNGLLLLELKARKTPRESAWQFGFPDETNGRMLGKNRHVSTLAKGISWVLGKVDRGHARKAMELDEGRQFKPKNDE